MPEFLTQFILMDDPFNQGYIAGISVILAVLIVLLILRLIFAFIFRTKRCSCITIAGERGDIHVSGAAITSTIKALESEFRFITIEKVRLYTKKNIPRMNIDILFNPAGGGLAPQSADLQNRVLSTLFETFGIEGIKKIDITLKNIKSHDVPNNFSPGLQ
jgi:hypothetical protein